MKRSDDVFFFTLIDFLLQVFFFGLVLYVFSQMAQKQAEDSRKQENAEIDKLKVAAGISNLTEITDMLTNLAPLKELKGTADFINRAGGLDKVATAVQTIDKAGGAGAVERQLEKLRKLEEGSGRPPCLFSMSGDKKVVRPLATVVATDSLISFVGTNADLEEALRVIGRNYDSVRQLPFSQFRNVFSELVSKKPECRYTLRFKEETSLVYARDAARFAFYLNIESAK